MSPTRMKNLHVPLPEELHGRLRAESERTDRPATELAREAIDRWLDERQRLAVHEEIQRYARRMAGTAEDLDEALEDAGLEELRGGDGPPEEI